MDSSCSAWGHSMPGTPLCCPGVCAAAQIEVHYCSLPNMPPFSLRDVDLFEIRCLSGTQCFTTQLSYEIWHLMNLQEHFTPTRNELLMQISQVLDTQQISQFLSISRLFNICPIYCSGLNNAGRAGQSQPCGILSSRKYC